MSKPIGIVEVHYTIEVKLAHVREVTRSQTNPRKFSRASRQVHAFTSDFDWFVLSYLSFVTEQSEFFDFGLATPS